MKPFLWLCALTAALWACTDNSYSRFVGYTDPTPPRLPPVPDGGPSLPFDAGGQIGFDSGFSFPSDGGFVCDFGDAGANGVDTEPLVTSTPAPVPISGGTLIVAQDGVTAVASDPDRDQLDVVNLTSSLVTAVPLAAGDEPGRLVEDASGRVHVALRRGGAVATLDLQSLAIVDRTAVCPEPRGIAYDAVADVVHVACTDGHLVTLPAAGGAPTRTLQLPQDARDVIVSQGDPDAGSGTELWVTFFRSAQVLVLDANGATVTTYTPNQAGSGQPGVAWRAVLMAAGVVGLVHEVASTTVNLCNPNPYGSGGGFGSDPFVDSGFVGPLPDGGFNGGFDAGGFGDGFSPVTAVVGSALTFVAPRTGQVSPVTVFPDVLTVDAALTPDGTALTVVGAGGGTVSTISLQSPCTATSCPFPTPVLETSATLTYFEPTAVAYDGSGRLIVQTRDPALYVLGASPVTIALPGAAREHTGHRIFHADSGGGIACASCHPEAREDGRVWNFFPNGPRRTMSVSGGILSRAPYHWAGDEANLDVLMGDVFVHRMSGGQTSPQQNQLVGEWLDGLPSPTPPVAADSAAVSRGQALFTSPSVGCSLCHSGALYTNDTVTDVGTGGLFKPPSLKGLWARPPYLHDGCARTLADRFGVCATPQHGLTSGLTAAQISDLIAYLSTL